MAPQDLHELCGPKRSLRSALPAAVNSDVLLSEMRCGAEMGPGEMGPVIITSAIAILTMTVPVDGVWIPPQPKNIWVTSK